MPIKVNDAIEITVLVAEEDYRYNLFEWNEMTEPQKALAQREAYEHSGAAMSIYMQRWMLRSDDNEHHSLQASLNELMGRSWKVIG